MAEHEHKDDRNGVPDSVTALVPFSLRCDLETIRRSAKGSITGSLHVQLGMLAFPDRGWSDFVVVVLVWWLDALYRLAAGHRTVALEFMDGPYAMQVTAVDMPTWTLECVRKAGEIVVLSKVRVDAVQVIMETERVARQIVKICETRGWKSPDLDTLRDLLNRPMSS